MNLPANVQTKRFGQVGELLRLYSRASLVLSVRMDPLIGATILCVPAAAIEGQLKIGDLAEILGQPMVEISDPAGVAES